VPTEGRRKYFGALLVGYYGPAAEITSKARQKE
jgi:hypothetical protein